MVPSLHRLAKATYFLIPLVLVISYTIYIAFLKSQSYVTDSDYTEISQYQPVAVNEDYHKALKRYGAVVLSVCNKPKYNFCQFLYSAQSYGAMVHLINYGAQGHRNSDKLFVMKAELDTYSNDTILIFSDCLDVIFNNHFEQFIDTFKRKNVPLMLAVEYYCWPDEVILKVKPNAKVKKDDCYRAYKIADRKNDCVKNGPLYVNSGLYIGYAKALKELITEAVNELYDGKRGGYDDQRFFHEAFLQRKFGAEADYCVEFFMCMFGIDKKCLGNCPFAIRHQDHLSYGPSSARPFMVHFEASSKTELFPLFVNSSMYRQNQRKVYSEHLLWVNGQSKDILDLCPGA